MVLHKVLYRVIPLVCLLSGLPFQTFGQITKDSDVLVYSRDGSIYKGTIVDEDLQSIQMSIMTGDTIVVSKSMIRKVKRGTDYMFYSRGRTHDIKGFFWSINMGMNADNFVSGTDEDVSSHLQFLFGWRMDKRWSFAAGLGTEFNSSQVGGFYVETQFASTYLYGRYYLNDHRRRLFAYGRLGYGFGQQEEFENVNNSGGFQGQAGIGIHFASRKRSRFIMSLGYYMQRTHGTQRYLDVFDNEILVDFNLLIHRPVLKFGVEFR